MSLRVPPRTRSRSRSIIRQPSSDRPAKLMNSHPSSRSASPAMLSRRPSKLEEYLSKSSRRNSCVNLAADIEHVPTGMHAREIKRWDGLQRMTTRWDSIRRDPEIWLHNGDCLIHLYEKGSSRRGASLRVSLADIESSNCRPLLNEYQLQLLDPARQPCLEPDRASRFSGYFEETFPQYELFIPAPSHLSKEEALQYHLTTRNFFAWMYNRPLVGERLGQSIIRLQGRMDLYRSSVRENQDNLLAFLEDQGYLDLRHCPDHALAMLQYAEHYRFRELWTDAFVHCAGMNDELDASCEYENVTRASQALIVRAHIEMDIRLERAGKSLESFLENDIPGVEYPLGREARVQLERFRSFLQCYYVGRYGYWPPALNKSSGDALPKPVYQSMYFDLRNLYEYLVDKNSDDLLKQPATGSGIAMSDVINCFDAKNKFSPLPHTLALLPQVSEPVQRRKFLWNIFSYSSARKERRLAAFSALKEATNHDDHRVLSSNIVREYLRFERDWTMMDDPSTSCGEARKVRWLLVYAMLQVLISIAKVPEEVRDTDGVDYPLCCQTAGTPPWAPGRVEPEKSKPREPTTPSAQIADRSSDLKHLKPSPLRIPQSTNSTPSPPRRSILPADLTLKAPKPIRSSSIDFLQAAGDSNFLSPPVDAQSTAMSLSNHSAITLTTPAQSNRGPAPPSPQDSDPSTPSSTEMSGSGWSPSSSEDDMEHKSVVETDSNYGDDEAEVKDRKLKVAKTKYEHRYIKRVPSGGSLIRANPEVEQFLSS